MRIRQLTPDDLDLLVELRLRFVAEHRGVSPGSFSSEFRERTRRFLDRHQHAGTIRSWVADADDAPAVVTSGRAIGVVSMLLLDMAPLPEDPRSTDGYLINMYVDPDERGCGVGRTLLDTCRDDAQALGVHRLLLFTTSEGRPLYESAGFRADPDRLDTRLRAEP